MQGSELKARPRVVEKLLNQVARAETSTEDVGAVDAFQEARARSRETVMLDVMLPDGVIESFDYASLRRVRYKPDGSISMHFGRDEVRLQGTNLLRLREALTEHRVRFVKKGTEAERDIQAEDAAHIELIEITEGTDE